MLKKSSILHTPQQKSLSSAVPAIVGLVEEQKAEDPVQIPIRSFMQARGYDFSFKYDCIDSERDGYEDLDLDEDVPNSSCAFYSKTSKLVCDKGI